MATVVGVRFKTVGKVYYFDPAGEDYPLGSRVIVESSRGIECGEVAMKSREVPDDSVVKPLKTVIRARHTGGSRPSGGEPPQGKVGGGRSAGKRFSSMVWK